MKYDSNVGKHIKHNIYQIHKFRRIQNTRYTFSYLYHNTLYFRCRSIFVKSVNERLINRPQLHECKYAMKHQIRNKLFNLLQIEAIIGDNYICVSIENIEIIGTKCCYTASIYIQTK